MDQRLSYYAKSLQGTREAKLSLILIYWTKYQPGFMTNKSSPTLKVLPAWLHDTAFSQEKFLWRFFFLSSGTVQRQIYVTMKGLHSSILLHISAAEDATNFLNHCNVTCIEMLLNNEWLYYNLEMSNQSKATKLQVEPIGASLWYKLQ